MNIGIFIQAYLPKIGGAQLSTHCLANSLVKQGHNVIIFTEKSLAKACKNNKWSFRYQLIGVKIPRNRLLKTAYPLWRYLLTRIIAKSIAEFNLEIVQIINAWPWIAIDHRQLGSKVPIVLRAVGDDIQIDANLNYGMRRDKKIAQIVNNGYARISCAIANSETTKSEYLKIGLTENKIKKITPGVDIGLFEGRVVDRKAIRSIYGIPDTKQMLLSVGRNHQKKGYGDLIQALKYLNQDQDKFCVVIIGKYTKELTGIALGIGQDNNFYPIEEISSREQSSITDFPPKDLISLYKAADIFVLPSILETYGNVKLEAMAAGLPVVVTDAPGARDSITHRKTGFIVPVNSPEALAAAVIEIDSDKGLKQELIENGKTMAYDQDWDNVAEKYYDVYSSLSN